MVSIITPTYNRAKYLKRAVDSVLTQTYLDLELIIVDDNPQGSDARADTEKIISMYNDPRLRYIQNEKNIGGAASRNFGIFTANGNYIAFLDDDDMYLPTKIETQVEEMDRNGWDFCVMDGATYNMAEEKLSERHQNISNNMTSDELLKVHLISHISGTNTFMFKKEFLQSIGGFGNLPSCHEYELIQKAIEAGGKLGYIPQILIRNYMHEGEQISTGNKKIDGIEIMYKLKQKYFHLLTKREKGYVNCRYHGVLFFVYLKRRNYFIACKEAILCFFFSPVQACRWMMDYRKKIIN